MASSGMIAAGMAASDERALKEAVLGIFQVFLARPSDAARGHYYPGFP